MWTTQFILLPLLLLFSFTWAGYIPARDCLCYLTPDLQPLPGSYCPNLPTLKEWGELNRRISGTISYPKPSAWPCYNPLENNTRTVESQNDPACRLVQERWTSSEWRSDQPGAMQTAAYEASYDVTESAPINATMGTVASQGNVNVVSINALTIQDIVEAFRFTKTHNLRAMVKNTGHDQLGRSTFKGAVQIWTHKMKGVELIRGWKPSCENSYLNSTLADYDTVIKVQSGTQAKEVYSVLDNNGLAAVAPSFGSVGFVGGWLLGGGYSVGLSGLYGLGVDNVLEFQVVTPDGQVLIANHCTNPDLFWALRGGGPGVGVVASAVVKVHAAVSLLQETMTVVAPDDETLASMLKDVIQTTPQLVEEAWTDSGMWDISNRMLSFGFLLADPKPDSLSRTVAPLLDRLAAKGKVLQRATVEYPSVLKWQQASEASLEQSGMPVIGGYTAIASHLIHDIVYTEHVDQLVSDVIAAGKSKPSTPILVQMVASRGVRNAAKDDAMALNPAWRRSYHHMITFAAFNSTTPVEEQQTIRLQTLERANLIGKTSAQTGAYLNEASLIQNDWQYAFFGTHYDQLRQIKLKYDPQATFFAHKSVGSDLWDDDALCRVTIL